MAANQRRNPIVIGFTPPIPGAGTSTIALSTAASGGYSATWLALGFRPDQAKTLNKVQVYCSAVASTLGSSDLVCDVYSSSAGVPGSSLQSSSTVTTTPTGAAWVEFTGFTYALSAGTQYWLVFRNANATPTTNYPTYRYGGSGTVPVMSCGSTLRSGWASATTTSSGGTWSNAAACCGYRLQYSDSTYAGFPVQAIVAGADKAYGSTEAGVQFTVPSGAKWNIRGATFYLNEVGSPTGNIVYRLYQNGTYVARTLGVNPTDPFASFGSGYVPDYFSSDVTVNPGDVVIVTVGDSAADSGSAYFYNLCEYQFASDANTQALMPFEGTLAKITTTNGGSGTPTFSSPVTTSILPFALLLDTAGEFASASGGGGYQPTPMILGG